MASAEDLDHVVEELHRVFLSPACSTESKQTAKKPKSALSEKAVRKILSDSVPGVERTLDRLQQVPVSDYIWSTYRQGLPAYTGPPREHSKVALQCIFHCLQQLPTDDRRTHLARIVEAFTACQAVQFRVIDAVYGNLCGRDMGIRDQVLFLVDEQKQRVLDEVAHRNCAGRSGGPSTQLPHIQSAYRASFGERCGLRGVTAGKGDRCKPSLSQSEVRRLEELFRSLFDVNELVDSFVADINLPNTASTPRLVSRAALAEWVGTHGVKAGLDPHSIFYDEDLKAEYPSEPPADEQYEPFLRKAVAVNILRAMFL